MIELGNEFPFSDEDEIKISNDEPILEGVMKPKNPFKKKKKTKAEAPKTNTNVIPTDIVSKRKTQMVLMGGKNKRKYSKKAYQFSKSKKRTKKQLI